MSMKTYPIIGFGAKIDYNLIDLYKYVSFFKKNIDEPYYSEIIKTIKNKTYNNIIELVESEDWDLDDSFNFIINAVCDDKFKNLICFTYTEEDGDYLLYFPTYPWNLTVKEKSLLSDVTIRETITNILMSIYKDDIDRKTVEDDIDEINSYYIG